MAVVIETNPQGLFKLTSTINGKKIHIDEFINEDEVKQILINKELYTFLEKVIKINMDFPIGYVIDSEFKFGNSKSDTFITSAYGSNVTGEKIMNKFIEIRDKLKLEFNISFLEYNQEKDLNEEIIPKINDNDLEDELS